MGDHAVRGGTLVGRYTPGIRSGLNQHHSRGSTALAHILMRFTDAAAAAGRETAPHPFTSEAFTRGWIFGGDLGPIAFELFGNQLRQAGQGALPHLGTNHPNDHGVIRTDDDPGTDFRCRLGRSKLGRDQQRDTQREATTNGSRAGDKLTTSHHGKTCIHVSDSFKPWRPCEWQRGLPEKSRTGKCWSRQRQYRHPLALVSSATTQSWP